MGKFIVEPIDEIKGEIRVRGAKNGVLPVMAASILTSESCIIEDVPDLRDVEVMSEVLKAIGSEITRDLENNTMTITTPNIISNEAPYEYVSMMRASFDVMGPLLARTGIARVPMPGGCSIGERPIDLHLKGFKALGAEIELGHGFVQARADKLVGNKVYLDFPSVGATKNIMMAATTAEGTTQIDNAAKEPEIVDLANYLNKLGAKIRGAGTDSIRIDGVKEFKAARHTVLPDRIVAGTYLIMAAMHKSDLVIENIEVSHLIPVVAKLRECGVQITEMGDKVRVVSDGNLKAVDIKTLPYPGFPTDLQAQFMSLLSIAQGSATTTETVFDNRFLHVSELNRMGANIKIEGHSAITQGGVELQGAQVRASDLRAGAALILAALSAKGKTSIHDIHHIDRGYSRIDDELKSLGINITREE